MGNICFGAVHFWAVIYHVVCFASVSMKNVSVQRAFTANMHIYVVVFFSLWQLFLSKVYQSISEGHTFSFSAAEVEENLQL